MANELIKKEISLLGRDFGEFRKNLIEFGKTYFPNTYNDFNESSPGMMFIEMAAYVGDVLSFYTDTQLRESLLTTVEEKGNLYNLATAYAYKPKNVVPATVDLDVYQLVPSMGVGDDVKPDYDYALKVASGMIVTSTESTDVEFRTISDIDFSVSSSNNPTEVTVYSVDDTTNEPIYYLLKKKVVAYSGLLREATFDFGTPKIYDKIKIQDTDIIKIFSVIDSDGDEWTEVPFLAQDTVFSQVENTPSNSVDLFQYANEVPYLLELKTVPKRFVTRFEDEETIVLQFGAGVSQDADEEILPNPDNVGSELYQSTADIDQGLDPSNFLYTKTYGIAPSNTTLTVRYLVGNGVIDNVPAKDLTTIDSVIFENDNTLNLDQAMFRFAQNSLAVTNPTPARGGRSTETLDEIRNNALAYFAAQNRTVTREDYIMRCYALPPQFGSVSKAFLAKDYQLTPDGPEILNQLGIDLYVLGYDGDKRVVELNSAVKNNLKNYLSYYRMITDAVNIKPAYIVNIGVDFEITVLPGYNSNEVLLRCISTLKDYFNIDRWSINQPINLGKIYVLLDNIDGVQSVIRPDNNGNGGLQITNKVGGNYSPNSYNIQAATQIGIIYPPILPSIFEVKFPDFDIKGRVIQQQF
jgi:hypothetical protein